MRWRCPVCLFVCLSPGTRADRMDHGCPRCLLPVKDCAHKRATLVIIIIIIIIVVVFNALWNKNPKG